MLFIVSVELCNDSYIFELSINVSLSVYTLFRFTLPSDFVHKWSIFEIKWMNSVKIDFGNFQLGGGQDIVVDFDVSIPNSYSNIFSSQCIKFNMFKIIHIFQTMIQPHISEVILHAETTSWIGIELPMNCGHQACKI